MIETGDAAWRVRPAAPDDFEAIAAIYRHEVLHGTGTFETDPPDRDEMLARHARFVGAGYPYVVAASPTAILGYAYCGPFRERSAFRFTLEDSIYVRRDSHGSGIGRALLDTLLSEATASGFRQMVAVVGDSRNTGSIALHAKAGFMHAGRLNAFGWKAGQWLDCVLMQRALGAGATTSPDQG